mmetsp:Transcript_1722/g.5395  ORF Transcript_1722/g.5395 Transcript_1722/m.5395 type:complete len:264 (-) Transcript_1722:39-830(-)
MNDRHELGVPQVALAVEPQASVSAVHGEGPTGPVQLALAPSNLGKQFRAVRPSQVVQVMVGERLARDLLARVRRGKLLLAAPGHHDSRPLVGIRIDRPAGCCQEGNEAHEADLLGLAHHYDAILGEQVQGQCDAFPQGGAFPPGERLLVHEGPGSLQPDLEGIGLGGVHCQHPDSDGLGLAGRLQVQARPNVQLRLRGGAHGTGHEDAVMLLASPFGLSLHAPSGRVDGLRARAQRLHLGSGATSSSWYAPQQSLSINTQDAP